MVYVLKTAGDVEAGRSAHPIVEDGNCYRTADAVWFDPAPGSGAYVETEAGPTPVPSEVTMRQARLALLAAGKLDDVEAALDALPVGAVRDAARIAWDYSSMVERHYGLVSTLGPLIGLDDETIDALFIAAAAL